MNSLRRRGQVELRQCRVSLRETFSIRGANRDYERAAIALSVLLLIIGCGGSGEATSLSGAVTVAGEPVQGGAMNFFPADGGRPVASVIDAEGHYRLRLPPGEYKVAAQASSALPEGWKEGDPVTPPPVPIPQKYSLPKSSPLTVTITKGTALEKDFEL